MSENTRDQFIAAAQPLFAEKGFYGASIATIARELGLTKQALLHHFGNKEKLYGEVLRQISDQLLGVTRGILDSDRAPADKLVELVLAQYHAQVGDQDSARLIMRELLDNEQRAEKAGNWYLKPYLEQLVDTAQAVESLGDLDRPRALALIYQLLGAAHYFAVSQPTLANMFGAPLMAQSRDVFEEELRTLIRCRLGRAA